MAPDSAVTTNAVGNGEVMASVDDGRLLIADISQDDAWLAVRCEDGADLTLYR